MITDYCLPLTALFCMPIDNGQTHVSVEQGVLKAENEGKTIFISLDGGDNIVIPDPASLAIACSENVCIRYHRFCENAGENRHCWLDILTPDAYSSQKVFLIHPIGSEEPEFSIVYQGKIFSSLRLKHQGPARIPRQQRPSVDD